MPGEIPYYPNRLFRNVGLLAGIGGAALSYWADKNGLPGLEAGLVDRVAVAAGVVLSIAGSTALIANLGHDRY